jgi:phosphopantothenoylcysteine decarboxylase/phosphopantothenate--cysteine ligase
MKNASPATSADSRPRRIVLGITGGIAAYKSAELTRLLVKAGFDVRVVMTAAAQQFITPVTLQALSGNPVFTDLWDAQAVGDRTNNMAHIELTRDADLILVAPATADFMAKLAHGLADDLLATLCVARNAGQCPLLLAPAMNREMWDQPATRRNVRQLIADGVSLLGPDAGSQACGETGLGRMLEPDALLAAVQARFANKRLSGRRALVTAGPTFEPIDPVRGITNSSSGKMGYAIAAALREAGADVILVSGPTALPPPHGVKTLQVQTASQMLSAVNDNLSDLDFFFAVAAVADYTPVAPKSQKMKKSGENLSLALAPTTDILASVASRDKPPFCVGFAAESDNVVEYARKKRENKRIPMIVANLATTAIGADHNEVTIIDQAGEHAMPTAPKAEVARAIVEHAARLFLSPSATHLNPIKTAKHA